MGYLNRIKSKFKYPNFINIVFIAIIFVVCLWDAGSLERIRVVDDGFCYWGIAADFAGYDWTELMAESSYYSYGYSVILIPLFWLHRLGLSMAAIYRLAIVLNALFLSGCYLMMLYMLRELFKDIPEGLKPVISLFTTLYIGNTAQMGLAWTETFLLFMFWCVTVLLYRVIRKPGYGNILGLMAATAWLFVIHMRSIGVVIAVCVVILGYFASRIRRINKRYIICAAGAAIVFFALALILKNYVTDNIYLGTAAHSTNNVQAGITRVGSLMNIRGIMDLAVSVIGKLFYVGTASFLLIIAGALSAFVYLLGSLIKKKGCDKRQKWQSKEWLFLFALLSFLAEIGIEAIFQCIPFFREANSQMRYDAFAFGRYADFVMGPMIILGIWAVYHLREHYKEIIAVLLISIVSSGIVQFFYNVLAHRRGSDTVSFRFAASPWLAMLMDGHKIDFACGAMMLSIGILLVFVVCGLLAAPAKSRAFGAMFLVLAAVWSVLGVIGGMEYTESKIGKEKAVDTVARIVEITGEDTPIYMVGKPNTEVKILQWLLADRSIHVCSLDKLDEIDLDAALILGNSAESQTIGALDDRLDFLYDSGYLSVYAAIENKYYESLSAKAKEMAHSADPTLEAISLPEAATELSYTKSYGGLYYYDGAADGGYMTESMGVSPEDGVYEFNVDMSVRGCVADTEIGYITVGDADGGVQYTRVLDPGDFMEKERQNIELPVKIKDWATPFIGIYTYGSADIKISSITYRKTDGCIQLDSDEIADIAAFLGEQVQNGVCYVDSDNSGATGFPYWEYGELDYLPGAIVGYKQNFEDIFYVAEKTDMDVIKVLEDRLDAVYETEGYIVFAGVNDN